MSRPSPTLLRRALQIDLGFSAICTLVLLIAAQPLADLTGLSALLVRGGTGRRPECGLGGCHCRRAGSGAA